MQLSLTDYILWLASPLFQVGVVVALFRRGSYKEYPYFYSYTILQVAGEAILLVMQRQSYTLYYYSYWVILAISAVISFAVLYEIFKNAFRPYEALRDFSFILFRWSALVILLAAGMWALTSSHSDEGDTVRNVILLAARSVRLMQCALVFLLLLLSEYLGISRRSLLFGIALGFGFFASVSMLVTAGLSHQSLVHVSIFRLINWAAYDLAALIWLGYTVLAPSRTGDLAAMRSKDLNSALENARAPLQNRAEPTHN